MSQREPDDEAPPVMTTCTAFQIGQPGEFYQQCFEYIDEATLRIIKAFMETIMPENKPTAPDWWPKNVRYSIELDRLEKSERISLLIHVLRLPRKEQHHPNIQPLNLRVSKLKSLAIESLSSWILEKENAWKVRILKHIFEVARGEERYEEGGIDGATMYFIPQPRS